MPEGKTSKSLAELIGRAFLLDKLIRKKMTGPPLKLAAQIGVSKRHVYNYLAAFRSIGKDAVFDEEKESYVYKDEVEETDSRHRLRF